MEHTENHCPCVELVATIKVFCFAIFKNRSESKNTFGGAMLKASFFFRSPNGFKKVLVCVCAWPRASIRVKSQHSGRLRTFGHSGELDSVRCRLTFSNEFLSQFRGRLLVLFVWFAYH